TSSSRSTEVHPAGSCQARMLLVAVLIAAAPWRSGPRRGALTASDRECYCRARVHPLSPREQPRAALARNQLREIELQVDCAARKQIDVGERVVIACDPEAFSELPFRLVDREGDLFGRIVEIGLLEARARGAPFLALIRQRNALHQPLELGTFD